MSEQLALIQTDQLQQLIALAIKPLHDELKQLRLQLQEKEEPMLTVKSFAKKAGISTGTVRNYLEAGTISFHQKGEGYRIAIPTTELLKLKKI